MRFILFFSNRPCELHWRSHCCLHLARCVLDDVRCFRREFCSPFHLLVGDMYSVLHSTTMVSCVIVWVVRYKSNSKSLLVVEPYFPAGTLQSFGQRSFVPSSYSFVCHFDREGTPFVFLWLKGCPFHNDTTGKRTTVKFNPNNRHIPNRKCKQCNQLIKDWN